MTSGSLALEFSWLRGEGGAHILPQNEEAEGEGGRTRAGQGGQRGFLRSLLGRESRTNLNAQNVFRNLPRLNISSRVVWGLSVSEPQAELIKGSFLGDPTPDN